MHHVSYLTQDGLRYLRTGAFPCRASPSHKYQPAREAFPIYSNSTPSSTKLIATGPATANLYPNHIRSGYLLGPPQAERRQPPRRKQLDDAAVRRPRHGARWKFASTADQNKERSCRLGANCRVCTSALTPSRKASGTSVSVSSATGKALSSYCKVPKLESCEVST